MKAELEEHYPLRKAAEILGVHPITLRRWEKIGKIRCVRTPSGRGDLSEIKARFLDPLSRIFEADQTTSIPAKKLAHLALSSSVIQE